MKILVTGGAGYLGSILVSELLKLNHEVFVIDNFMYQQTSLLHLCSFDKLHIMRADVRDKLLVSSYMNKVDCIIPLACLTGAPLCDENPWLAKEVNYEAVAHILQSKNTSQMLIFPMTNSGYGVGQDNIFCTEETPLLPVSYYGRLKVELEKHILSAENTISLRFATLFGISPRMRLDLLVNDFSYRAFKDRFIVLYESHFKRNYLHVRDAARAMIYCLEHFDVMKAEAYNVGLSDANLTKLELCHTIKKYVPEFCIYQSEVGKDPDQRNYIVSNEKMKRMGFEPEISLESGIVELMKGFTILPKAFFSNV